MGKIDKFTTNLKINPEQKLNLQVMATLENLSVVDYTLMLHKGMLERIKREMDNLDVVNEEGEGDNCIDIKRYGFKTMGEFVQSLTALLKNRKELIDKIPDVNEKDEFEVVVLKALNEIQSKPVKFQREVMPDVMYKEGKFEKMGEPVLEEKPKRSAIEIGKGQQFVV